MIESYDVSATDFIDVFTAKGADLSAWQAGLRTVLVYIAALTMVRIGKQRLFGKNTAFDVTMGVVLGSVIGRGITGSATLASTCVAGLVIIALHALSAKVSFHSLAMGNVIKGSPRTIVRDGQLCRQEMERTDISEHDIEESARLQALPPNFSTFQEARLERNGQISFLPKKGSPQVVEVKVENGVQTVRIEMKS